jgi:signal transduction histidine kinase
LITDFQLARKPVLIGVDSVLQKSILETENLTLSYLDRVLSFEFGVLNYRASHQNLYKYRLEGFEKEWNETNSTRRFATYTNLNPGDYVFWVIGSNNDGIWNEAGASIRITVTPPWWETMWFRISMVAASIALLFGVIHLRIRSIEARRRKLELLVQKRTQELAIAKDDALKARDAAEIADKAKSDFLANMSHELRTPLNAILGFSVMLQEEDATPNQQEKLAIINRSGQHLLSMINDVLDLSKIEAERIELKEHPFDLVGLIGEISVMIQSRATEKGLSLSVAVETESISVPYVRADMGKLREILINLLSNAVKFTDEGGVTIRCATEAIPEEPKHCSIVIEVEDTGPGIDPSRQGKIFEPFVQGIEVPERKGTGLGLSICKKYADFMGGTIELESEVGKGSLFRLRLPSEIAEAVDVKAPVDDKPRVIGLKNGVMELQHSITMKR